ncbi:sulfatase family protein [Pelagicoccus mobilis]|uniref:Sulfatase-like hydrolase/transferase n=1 Tax=Pelagicoccus mobilis TaxID=415221 RepID=A0A934VNB0_9BACT|nr:sulfatase-like hydrolase/transferase [Pelagicoccus mobilis]MBK1879741.1 sulfatase-like hydrolase/transferase [Pelagicoccus mobilis]
MPLSNTKPNILYIMTDQQRFDAMSAHGGLAQTPHLDRLSQEGANFHGFFSNAPVCVPSRCSLFSGQYTLTHGVLENDGRLSEDSPFLPKDLAENGYSLGYFGKNHLLDDQDPRLSIFDAFDICEDANCVKEDLREVRQEFLDYRKARGERLGEFGSWASADFHDYPEEVTAPYILREKAIQFIDQHDRKDPFCVVLSFEDPHVPHVAPKRFEATHPPEEMPIPSYPEETFQNKASRYDIKRIAQGSADATDSDKQKYIAVYHAMISWIDENVGAVLDHLEKTGLKEDTIVVFTSDHGDFAFHWGMCKKDLDLVDHLLHVPGIISWPGKIEPRDIPASQTLAEAIDLFPTLLDFAGIDIPKESQGKSLKRFLLNETDSHKQLVYSDICYEWMKNPYKDYDAFIDDWKKASVSNEPHLLRWTAPFNVPGDHSRAVRSQQWKYIWYHDGHEELYHVEEDPEEFFNLAIDPAYADTLAAMRQQLKEAPASKAKTEAS